MRRLPTEREQELYEIIEGYTIEDYDSGNLPDQVKVAYDKLIEIARKEELLNCSL